MDRSKHKILDEQQKVIVEAICNKQQKELEEEFKRAGVRHEPYEQVEQLKRLQEEHLRSKANKDTDDGDCSKKPIGDPKNHQHLQQSEYYDYQGRQESSYHQRKAQDITIGSVVVLPNAGGGASIYGVVRWIGTVPNVIGKVAGIELVSS